MSGAEPGYLTNQEETLTDSSTATADGDKLLQPDHRDEIVMSVPQDVEERHQVQAQRRRLDAAALQAFKDRCYETSDLSGSDAYVDCDNGYVNGDSSTTCDDACIVNGESKCCTGNYACKYFTGKGKSKGSSSIIAILSLCIVVYESYFGLTNHFPYD